MAYLTLDTELEKSIVVQLEKTGDLKKQVSFKMGDSLESFVRDKLEICENLDKTDFKKTEYLSRLIMITKKETIEELFTLIKRVNMSNPQVAEQLKDLLINKL